MQIIESFKNFKIIPKRIFYFNIRTILGTISKLNRTSLFRYPRGKLNIGKFMFMHIVYASINQSIIELHSGSVLNSDVKSTAEYSCVTIEPRTNIDFDCSLNISLNYFY